jgi:NADH-quinone oxidoreductase subunit K
MFIFQSTFDSGFELLPLSTCLFLLGFIGILESREFLSLLISTEVVMLGANFSILTNSLVLGDYAGQAYALCILAVTAAETAIGLGLLILLYRSKGSITFNDIATLKG